MRTNNPYRRRIISGAAVLLAALLLAGCNDDTVIYVEDHPPAIPTGVYTVTGDGYVEIYWNPVREEDMEGYGVYRGRTLDGKYERIATQTGIETTSYIDFDVANGTTYYYAVDAFDFEGNESELSYEAAFDTPRPAGFNVRVYSRQSSEPDSAGVDFSDWSAPGFVTAWDAPDTDIYFEESGGELLVNTTSIGGVWNDIQDLGWTGSMDDVSWAPTEGWSALGQVELIEDHTYVVWTHDLFFAKFRVNIILRRSPQGTAFGAVIDWAYQTVNDYPELSAYFQERKEARVDERGTL